MQWAIPLKRALVAALETEFAREPQATVFYGHPSHLATGPHVTVEETRGTREADAFAPGTRGFETRAQVIVRCGSGPRHSTPEDADRVAFDLVARVVKVAAEQPLLDGSIEELVGIQPGDWDTAIRWVDRWADPDGRPTGGEVVIEQTILVEIHGA